MIQVVAGVPIFGNTQEPAGPFGAFSVSSHFKTGYTQNSNLNVQYQVSNNSVFEMGYIGSLSRNLPVTLDINQIPIGTPALNSSRPYYAQFPNLATINEVQSVGSGYYNGMIMSLRSSGFHGFTTKVNYTLGHARDDLSGTCVSHGLLRTAKLPPIATTVTRILTFEIPLPDSSATLFRLPDVTKPS